MGWPTFIAWPQPGVRWLGGDVVRPRGQRMRWLHICSNSQTGCRSEGWPLPRRPAFCTSLRPDDPWQFLEKVLRGNR